MKIRRFAALIIIALVCLFAASASASYTLKDGVIDLSGRTLTYDGATLWMESKDCGDLEVGGLVYFPQSADEERRNHGWRITDIRTVNLRKEFVLEAIPLEDTIEAIHVSTDVLHEKGGVVAKADAPTVTNKKYTLNANNDPEYKSSFSYSIGPETMTLTIKHTSHTDALYDYGNSVDTATSEIVTDTYVVTG